MRRGEHLHAPKDPATAVVSTCMRRGEHLHAPKDPATAASTAIQSSPRMDDQRGSIPVMTPVMTRVIVRSDAPSYRYDHWVRHARHRGAIFARWDRNGRRREHPLSHSTGDGGGDPTHTVVVGAAMGGRDCEWT